MLSVAAMLLNGIVWLSCQAERHAQGSESSWLGRQGMRKNHPLTALEVEPAATGGFWPAACVKSITSNQRFAMQQLSSRAQGSRAFTCMQDCKEKHGCMAVLIALTILSFVRKSATSRLMRPERDIADGSASGMHACNMDIAATWQLTSLSMRLKLSLNMTLTSPQRPVLLEVL